MIEKLKIGPIRNYISNRANKKSLCYLAIVLVVALLVFVGLLYCISWLTQFQAPGEIILKRKEKSLEELLERLTPAEPEPLTPEKRKEQEKLLEQLTPVNQKPMTEQEKKEMEDLLKKLTP